MRPRLCRQGTLGNPFPTQSAPLKEFAPTFPCLRLAGCGGEKGRGRRGEDSSFLTPRCMLRCEACRRSAVETIAHPCAPFLALCRYQQAGPVMHGRGAPSGAAPFPPGAPAPPPPGGYGQMPIQTVPGQMGYAQPHMGYPPHMVYPPHLGYGMPPHMAYAQQQSPHAAQAPVHAHMAYAAAPAAPKEKICPDCGGVPGNHKDKCPMKGSVFDRVKKPSPQQQQAAAAAAAAAAVKGPEQQAASELGSATFQMKRADDGTAPIGSMEVVDDVTGEVQYRVPQVCNSMYNLNHILRTQILDSDYFKSLVSLTTFAEVRGSHSRLLPSSSTFNPTAPSWHF